VSPAVGATRGTDRATVTDRRFGRLAALGLAVTLFALTVLSLFGVTSTRTAASRVERSTALSQAYQRAKEAVAAEESLERKYRLEPGRPIRARHAAAGADLDRALDEVRALGDPADRLLIDTVRTEHKDYLHAIQVMFAAVDRGDTAGSNRVDTQSVDPVFDKIEKQVAAAADSHLRAADTQMAKLRHTEALVFGVTIAGFGVGLALVTTFALVILGYQRDVLRQSRANRHQATHDALTGLPNRVLFGDRLARALALAGRGGKQVGVMVIDLDRFKDVNDSLGHHCGDLLLSQIGPRVREALRDVDTLARLGGDEFAVLLPDTDEAGVLMVAERVLERLHSSYAVGEVTVDLEASVGVAVAPAHGSSAEDVLRHADTAMYLAKEARAGVAVYDPTVHGPGPRRLLLLGELRRALDQPDELVLHYQPKVELAGERVVGVEALLRWRHPERGLVQPGEFIAAAENTGLIHRLNTCVLTLAVEQLRRWLDCGYPVPVAVNLSARCLHDSTLPARIEQLLRDHRVPAALLRLEVTESAVMVDTPRALAVLTLLHQLGVRLSIDDFGTGYSSMTYLKRLPVDELKIDRSFVIGMTGDHDDATIVRTAIDLGHNLGLTVVAEGVETAGHARALLGLGCDVAQGNHYTTPLPPAELAAWLARAAAVPRARAGDPGGRL
jgi:diguanylate cyclase (GGDEF)-like protein